MRRLEITNKEITKEVINFHISKTSESRFVHRLHGILLILNGYSCVEVGKLFNHSPRTIEYWVKKLNKDGIRGLMEKRRRGRTSKLKGEDMALLIDDIKKHPRVIGYDSSQWSGKLVSHHIYQKFGIKLGVRQSQRLLHKLGFTLQRPRCKAARGDEREKEEFKKN